MRKEISGEPKYESEGRDAAAASALFTVVGSCVQRPNGVVSVIMRTQHAASLHANIPIYQYSFPLLYSHLS